ncbi:MAG: hypothetical protein ACI4JN_12065 [Ruminococcus sp.]
MKTCEKCGAQLADEAAICRECGEAQSGALKKSENDLFSMPYLSVSESAGSKKKSYENKSDEVQDTDDESGAVINDSDNKNENEKYIDPLEIAFAKKDKRNKLIRIIAVVIAGIMLLSVAGYFTFRSKGYYRTLDKFIDGRTSSSGTNYLSIVPEIYLINAEKQYDMRRPEIKSTTNNYLEYVENQYENDYGTGLDFNYKITSEYTSSDKSSLENIESSILSAYKTEIDISEAAYVTIRLTTKGSVTQSTDSKTLTFYKYDGKWYSLDAMEIIQFACENAGYNMW